MKKLLATLLLFTITTNACNPDVSTLSEDEEWAAYEKKYLLGIYEILFQECAYYYGDHYVDRSGYLQAVSPEALAGGTIRFTQDSFFIVSAQPSVYRTFPAKGKWSHSRTHPMTIYIDSYPSDGNDENIPTDTSHHIIQGWEAHVEIGKLGLSLVVPNNSRTTPPGKKPYTTFHQQIVLYPISR
jgi:hypothetical protein